MSTFFRPHLSPKDKLRGLEGAAGRTVLWSQHGPVGPTPTRWAGWPGYWSLSQSEIFLSAALCWACSQPREESSGQMSSCLFSWNLSHSGGCSAHVDMHQQAVLGECEVSRAVKGWGRLDGVGDFLRDHFIESRCLYEQTEPCKGSQRGVHAFLNFNSV